VEVYVPIRYDLSYSACLNWIIEEFTELRGGCTVHYDLGGYYLSRASKVINDRVTVVCSDFPMDWNNTSDQAEVFSYCATLRDFLFENLSEDEILISAYPVSHLGELLGKPGLGLVGKHLI
jgi:hypothetical protein